MYFVQWNVAFWAKGGLYSKFNCNEYNRFYFEDPFTAF